MMKKWWKKHVEPEVREDPASVCNPVCHGKIYLAYERLVTVMSNKKATKAELTAAMMEAIGFLGEVLE